MLQSKKSIKSRTSGSKLDAASVELIRKAKRPIFRLQSKPLSARGLREFEHDNGLFDFPFQGRKVLD